jgi:hypothetical protein
LRSLSCHRVSATLFQTGLLLSLTFLLPLRSANAQSTSGDLEKRFPKPLALRMVRQPLSDVANSLTAVCGVRLVVAKELSNQKVVLILQDRPVGEVLVRIAQTFGGQWVSEPSSGGEILRLELLPEVSRWLAQREQARKESENFARKMKADAFKKAVREHFDHTEDTNWAGPGTYDREACRFLKNLPLELLDRVAQQTGEANSVTDVTSVSDSGTYAARISLSALGPGQQQAFLNWVSRMPDGSPKTSLTKNLPNITIALGSRDGIGLSVGLRGPDASDGMPAFQMGFFATGGGGWSNTKVEEFRTKEFQRLMAPVPTPPSAFMEIQVTSAGEAAKKVVTSDPMVLKTRWTPPRQNPLYEDLLEELAAQRRFGIVADYYTLSQRLLPRPDNIGDLLEKGATTFSALLRILFREKNGILMVRHLDYPDLNRTELPYPLVEQWIAQKRQIKAEKNSPLTVPQVLEVSLRTPEELAALMRYDDPVSGVRFLEAAWLLEENSDDYEGRSNRYWVGMMARLKPELLTELLSPKGVPVKKLPLGLRNLVASQTRWRLKGKPLPSGGHLAMEMIFPASGEKEPPFTFLRIIWPDAPEERRPVNVAALPAALPEASVPPSIGALPRP